MKSKYDFVGYRPKTIDSLVIDVSHLSHRMAHSLKRFQTSDGRLSGHIFGSFNSIMSMWRELRPKNLVFVYDRGCKWRRDLVPSYKSSRRQQDTPSEIENGIVDEAISAPGDIRLPIHMRNWTPAFDVERLTRGFPAIHLSAPDCEADDMAAAFLKAREQRFGTIVFLTGDQDYWQLVSNTLGVMVLHPTREGGKLIYEWVDDDKVRDDLGVPARLVPRLKAVLGDTSDDITGVTGGARPGKIQALKDFLLSMAGNDYFDPTAHPTVLGVPDWLEVPLLEQRDRILTNLEVVTMGARVPPVAIVQSPADVANTMGILAEYECESLLEKVAPWFQMLDPENA